MGRLDGKTAVVTGASSGIGLAIAKVFVLSPEDIAQAVLFAVTMPESVHVNEIMVRPSQPMQMPGMRLPA